ncbi:hypothetical protein SUGI_1160650 [Cryptomeria japonica]|nr:hypothetical protein SUGI_1160650 [Cryptomeria japonica]
MTKPYQNTNNIFIGYGVGVKAYKLWKLVTGKVVYSRSVIFHELKPISLDHNIEKRGEAEVEIPPAKEESPEIPKDEESSSGSSSSEEDHDNEPPGEPQEALTPKLRRST